MNVLKPHLQTTILTLLGAGTSHRQIGRVEYIVVHELVHLIESNHTERFTALMDGFMPNWRACRELLNSGVLGHEVWGY